MVKKIRQQNDMKFEDYIERLTSHFGLSPTKENIISKIERCRSEEWKLMAHIIIGELFGHFLKVSSC
jgi:hypothetical protein